MLFHKSASNYWQLVSLINNIPSLIIYLIYAYEACCGPLSSFSNGFHNCCFLSTILLSISFVLGGAEPQQNLLRLLACLILATLFPTAKIIPSFGRLSNIPLILFWHLKWTFVFCGVKTTTRGSNGPQNVTQLTNDHPSRMKVMLQ